MTIAAKGTAEQEWQDDGITSPRLDFNRPPCYIKISSRRFKHFDSWNHSHDMFIT